MSEMDLWCSWINTEFYSEFFSCKKPFFEIGSIDNIGDSLREEIVYL